MSSSTPIHVSIYSLSHNSKENEQPTEFNFYATEKLTWNNLAQFIQESYINITTSPILLYYKINDEIKSLENQEQLEGLLKTNDIHGLRFYGQKELVGQPVFLLSPPPASPKQPPVNAFLKLGQLTEQHKKAISSSRELSRCVGILASAIAMDTQGRNFEKEFKALEKVIESRKEDFESISVTSKEDQGDERTLVNEEPPLDNLFAEFGHRGRGRRGGGFGIGFAGRGHFFGGGHRGGRRHHHHCGEHHHYPRGDFAHHHPSEEFERHYPRGEFGHHHTRGYFEGGRHYHHHHHYGGPAYIFEAVLASGDEEENGGKKKHRKAQACFRGREDGVLLGKEDKRSSDEISGLEAQLSNTHIDSSIKRKRGGKGSKKKHRHQEDQQEYDLLSGCF